MSRSATVSVGERSMVGPAGDAAGPADGGAGGYQPGTRPGPAGAGPDG